jgi:hypothetical protein
VPDIATLPSPIAIRRRPAIAPVEPGTLFPFETRRRGEPRSAPPRTVGVTSIGTDSPRPPESADAVAAIFRARNVPVSSEAAREKVGFACPAGATSIYQADREARSASLCACGNATAATLALLAQVLGTREVHHRLRLPEGEVAVQANVSRMADGALRVAQSWTGVTLQAEQRVIARHVAVVCTGSLNDYLLVRVPNRATLDAFDVADALALWAAARNGTQFADPLRSRLAAVAPGADRPSVKFFTCGRMHPGAPLTGLATLALAASEVRWLAELLAAGEIEHRRGVDTLPDIHRATEGPTIILPTIDVILHGM